MLIRIFFGWQSTTAVYLTKQSSKSDIFTWSSSITQSNRIQIITGDEQPTKVTICLQKYNKITRHWDIVTIKM